MVKFEGTKQNATQLTLNVKAVHEEEWSKINKLECDKAQLESHLSVTEQQLSDIQNTCYSLRDPLKDRQ